jgi:hypothetical protein
MNPVQSHTDWLHRLSGSGLGAINEKVLDRIGLAEKAIQARRSWFMGSRS